jgi:hypothetical protein
MDAGEAGEIMIQREAQIAESSLLSGFDLSLSGRVSTTNVSRIE